MKMIAVIACLFCCPAVMANDVVDDQLDNDPHALTTKDLPLFPIKAGQIIVAAGLSFDGISWTHGIFDPKQQIPVLTADANGQESVDLSPTSDDYFVTDDVMIACWSKGAKEPSLHAYRTIMYRFKDPTAHLHSVTVLSYDNVPFCICFGNMPAETPSMWSDARLEMLEGKVEIDVEQDESGSGGFHTHAYFEVLTDGPKLARLTQGGRGR